MKAGNNKKGRGKNKVNFSSNGPVKLVFNSFGQPIALAKSVEKFSRFIGSIAREPSMFPINISDFRKFKGTGRVKTAWEDIKAKIDWSDPETLAKMMRIRKTVVKKLNACWRKHNHDLYVDYYLDNMGLAERFKKTETFKKNRGQLKVAANTGTKIAQVRYEWGLANPGKVLDRCTFWRLVHSKTKKDGSGIEPINDKAKKNL
ncbi:hypothetical protein M0R45_027509 [Rubus argutus]|uniref:Transposase n=1 Tax=Rubus argutus TaxID=59490 RepID=A0AAW1X0K2_RUBAR